MNGRTIALTIIGFLIGALAAGSIGVRVIEEVRAEDDATSLPRQNVASGSSSSDYQPDSLIASSVVIPTSVGESDSSVDIAYDVISIAPIGSLPTAEAPFLFPDSWRLNTESGTVAGGPGGSGAGVAHFELPANTSANDIRSVDIVDPLMAYPLDASFDVSEAAPSATVTTGVQAELVGIERQDDSTIVHIDLLAEDPIDLAFTVEGVGSGWRSEPTRADSSRVEFLWVGDDLPDVLTFRAVGIQWVELGGRYPVSFGDVQ